MPRLFWPNFDFEHELAAGSNWQPSQKLNQLNARFAPVLGAMCQTEDRIVLPVAPSQETTRIGPLTVCYTAEQIVRTASEFAGPDWELVPWGATQSLQQLAEARGWTWRQPAVDLIKTLNDRTTSVQWEWRTKTAPKNLEVILSATEIPSAVRRILSPQWVIKARYGMSARERIVGTGTIHSDNHRSWLRKRLSEQGKVFFEPWLESLSESGLQFEISQTGDPQLIAVLPFINADTGEYRGSRLSLTEREQDQWQPAIEIGERIALEIQSLGYFGPLGTDAMLYQDRDETKLRPVMDLNARWTMGRIAWEWGQRLAPGENATWLLGSAAEEIVSQPPAGTQVIPTSSEETGGMVSALLVGGEFNSASIP